jgi:hypothetical protein
METLILEIPNPEDKEVFLLLASRLHCKVIDPKKKTSKTLSKKNPVKAFQYLEQLAKLGTLNDKIPDPVKWQKSIRKDRKLDR